MNKRIRTRVIVILAFTLLSIYFFAGFPPTVEHMKQRIHLGLDLQGGVQLVLKVNTNDAIRANTNQTIESLKTQLQKENITFRQLVRTQDDQFTANGVDPSKNSDFQRIMSELHSDWDVQTTNTDAPNSYLMQLKQAQAATLEQPVEGALDHPAPRGKTRFAW